MEAEANRPIDGVSRLDVCLVNLARVRGKGQYSMAGL